LIEPAAAPSDRFNAVDDPKGPNNTRPDGINDKRAVAGRFEATVDWRIVDLANR
jgi:hypothetical protein